MPPSRSEELARLLEPTGYRLCGLLGRGGMGEVYEVEHRFLGRRLALKVVSPLLGTEPGAAERLRREAEALGRLEHPNVVGVVDCWLSEQGSPCLVLELLEGQSLCAELDRRQRLPVVEAVHVARQILLGLGAAHEIGIVHRDVTPSNVFLHRQSGFEPVVKVLDFGLARLQKDADGPLPRVRTATGTLVGSARYMSPEALRREPLDERADLYGVGLLLYEMLTGEGPYDYGDGPPLAPSTRASEESPLLDAVVLRALREERSARFQTAGDFVEALDGLVQLPSPRASWAWDGMAPWRSEERS